MSIGRIDKFRVSQQIWNRYTARLERYFLVKNVKEETKTAILLMAVGDEIFKLIEDLCNPDKPQTESYDQLLEIVKKTLATYSLSKY